MRSRPRASSSASCCAAEDVVVGHGDRAEPDLLGRVEQSLRPGRCSRATTTCACGGRRRSTRDRRAGRCPPGSHAASPGQPAVEPFELAGYRVEAVARSALARGCRSFESEPLASAARRDELARLVEELGALLRGGLRSDVHPAAKAKGHVRPAGEGVPPHEHELPALEGIEAPDGIARDFALARDELDDHPPALPGVAKEAAVDAGRYHRVVAGEALGSRLRGRLRGR